MLRDLYMWSDKHWHIKISLNKYDSLCSADFNDQCKNQRKC